MERDLTWFNCKPKLCRKFADFRIFLGYLVTFKFETSIHRYIITETSDQQINNGLSFGLLYSLVQNNASLLP